jgi:alpha-L-rhamnosidase
MKQNSSVTADFDVVALTCEYQCNPLGVDELKPRLSWQLKSNLRGEKQTAYQIIVASTEKLLDTGYGDLWDSGKVSSDQSVHVEYAGVPLISRQACHWQVRVWGTNKHASALSAPAYWEMGLLERDDWKAHWIGGTPVRMPSPKQIPPSPIFRKVFCLEKPVRSARAYFCGLGYGELYINGHRIGENVLDPAFTRYDRRVLYVTHDVTAALARGENAIGVMLGNGQYDAHTVTVWEFHHAPWRDRPRMIFQMHVEYSDGTSELVISDAGWKASTGPVVFDGTRNGEIYDARLEKQGWTTPEYSDADWNGAPVVPNPGGVMSSQQFPPIRVIKDIAAVSMSEPKPGVLVFDMGQAFSGWARIKASGPAGTAITLKYAEKLTKDGDIDQGNINEYVWSDEFQTDRYLMKGEGIEEWEPRFTYHGFRYVQVTGFPGKPALDSVCGRLVHTALESAGEFACSNEMLNRLQQCALWSTVSNYHGHPTDCPHREKCGWTGDALVSAEQVLFNFKPDSAYTKWLRDMADEQRLGGQFPGIIPSPGWGYKEAIGPSWDSAYHHLSWYLYQYCGDRRILAEHYDGMKRYLDFLAGIATGYIVSYGLPDHASPIEHTCKADVTSTAYYFADAVIVAKIAEMLGRKDDAGKYNKLAETIKSAFIAYFYHPADGTIANGCQTAQACALYYGLVEKNERAKVFAVLLADIERKGWHLDCGILGVKYLMQVLTDEGRADVAYRIAAQTTFPSWGHWLNLGATTFFEHWDGRNSRIHHMFSDVSAWFYKALAGINTDPEQPGFKHVIIRPCPVGDLTWARGEHNSPYGSILSAWKREEDAFILDVSIPPNSSATVHLPTADSASVTEGGKPVSESSKVVMIGVDKGFTVLTVESGEYHFVTKTC